MPLPRKCDKCGRVHTPISSISRLCESCRKEIRIINGRMRNETFKNSFRLKIKEEKR